MISAQNISIQYGGRFLFNDIGFTITEKDRIGLVGKNGAGKTTLFRLLVEEMKPESGSISMDNNTSIGYLPQELFVQHTKTVFEETATAFGEVLSAEKTITDLSAQLAERTDYESASYNKLLHDLSDAQELFQRMGGMTLREDIEKVLKGLGFVNGDFDRPLNTFSGGWQMRVELAKILLRKPDFILLDEPTNHLDIESIMWLEEFLVAYPGGIMLISHDRAFLDRVTNRTIELVNGKLYDHRTSYSNFLELRELRRVKQIAEKKKQDKFEEHTKKLINKFRAKKNKAKFAQTLITKLERMEKVEIDDVEKGAIKFKFPDAPRSGQVVINIKGLTKHYGSLQVLNNIDFQLLRGEKVAFVGKNGEGKSTLSKIILGKTPYEGTCELGYNVDVGYYEQHQAESLDGKQTVLEVIDDAATGEMRYKVRSLLGAFMFSGEAVDKKVMVLSGGEKSRLALAKMLLEPVNLLVLDEPTNHLDMRSKDILKQALLNFTGAVIIVSHDREFLKGLTKKVYEFKNKKLKLYHGDVYNFLDEKQIATLDELGMKQHKQAAKSASLTKQQRIERHNTIRNLDKSIKRQSNKVSKSEKLINEMESRITELDTQMSDPDFYMSTPNANELIFEYGELKKKVTAEMDNWENLTLELEELKEQRAEYEV